MAGKYTAQQIAQWFLAYNERNVAEGGAETISNLKLQKLLYYAQGCYLGLVGEVLFNDPITAWKHGPVVASIYHEYKNHKDQGIEFEDDFDFSSIDAATTDILETVYDVFGQYSAWKLREMTHGETPWQETPQSSVIPVELIKAYFLEHYIES